MTVKSVGVINCYGDGGASKAEVTGNLFNCIIKYKLFLKDPSDFQ